MVVRGVTASRDGLSMSYPNFQDLRAAKPEGMADLIGVPAAADEPARRRASRSACSASSCRRTSSSSSASGRRSAAASAPTKGLVPDRDAVAVISHDLWQRAFAGDPATVGRAVIAERPIVHDRRHRAAGVPRLGRRRRPRRVRAGDDAEGGDGGRPAAAARRRLARRLRAPRRRRVGAAGAGEHQGRRRAPGGAVSRMPTRGASCARCRCGGPAPAACCCRCWAR